MTVWVVVWALLVAGFDVRLRRIPNMLSLGGAAVALLWLATFQHSLLGGTPLEVLAAFALALVLTVPAYAAKLLGAGDVKLLAAFSLMGGILHLLVVVVVAGIVSSAYALAQRSLIRYGMALDPGKKRHLPMGLFFGLGIVSAVVYQY